MNLAILLFPLLLLATWSFDKDEPEKPPTGFELTVSTGDPAGRWAVVKDGDQRVLAQMDSDDTNDRFAMAIVKDSSFKDLKLSVRAKAISGKVDQAAGLVWRYQDAENYYVARLNVLESNVRLYRVVKGNRIKFAGKEKVEMKAGVWYTLSIEQRGEAITVSLDGTALFESSDKVFAGAGKVGVWTKADSVTYFDDLNAEELK